MHAYFTYQDQWKMQHQGLSTTIQIGNILEAPQYAARSQVIAVEVFKRHHKTLMINNTKVVNRKT